MKESHSNRGYHLWLMLGCALTIGIVSLAIGFLWNLPPQSPLRMFDVVMILVLMVGGPAFFWIGEFSIARPITSFVIEPDGLRITEYSTSHGRRVLDVPWWAIERVTHFLGEHGRWYDVSIMLHRDGHLPERTDDGKIIHATTVSRHIIVPVSSWKVLEPHIPQKAKGFLRTG